MSEHYKLNATIIGEKIMCYARKYNVGKKKIQRTSQHHCFLIKISKWGLCTITKESVEWKEDEKGEDESRSVEWIDK